MLFRFCLVFLFGIFAVRAAQPSSGVSIDLKNGDAGWTATLRNDSSLTLVYSSYFRAQCSPPIYGMEVWRDGKCEEVSLGWCGMGIEPSFVPSKKSFTFDVAPTPEVKPGDRIRLVVHVAVKPRSDYERPKGIALHSNDSVVR